MLSRLTAFPFLMVLFDQALISGARVLTSIVITRFSAESTLEAGFYVSAFGFVVLFTTYQESFVATPLNVFLPRQPEAERGGFFAGALRFSLGLIILSAIISAMVFVMLPVDRSVDRLMALTVAWFVPLQLLREFGRRWLLATQRHGVLIALDVVATCVLLALLGVIIGAGQVNALHAFVVVSMANIVFVIAWFLKHQQYFAVADKPKTPFSKVAWNYGRWVAGESTFAVLMLYFSQWYISSSIDREEAGLYGTCLTLVFLTNPFLLGVTSFFSPRAATVFHESGWDALWRIAVKYSLIVAVVLTAIWMVIWLFGSSIMLVFGPEYPPAAPAAAWLSFGMVFLGLSYLLAITLQTVGLPQINAVASALGAIVVVVYSFLYLRDIHTAAYGFVLSAAIAFVTRLLALLILKPRLKRQSQATAIQSS
ncbi:MAG: hypothetical protein R3C03_22710 [Pirellulaceae bacterium]